MIAPFMVGAEITWPSSTIANWRPVPASWRDGLEVVLAAGEPRGFALPLPSDLEDDDPLDLALRDAGAGVVEVGALDDRSVTGGTS